MLCQFDCFFLLYALSCACAVEREALLAPYENTVEDMKELVTQLAYVAFFAIALPITPLLSIISNIVELRVDGFKLVNNSQRPHCTASTGLGTWNSALKGLVFIAMV